MGKLRIIRREFQIRSVLDRACEEMGQLTLWQTIDNQKTVFKCEFVRGTRDYLTLKFSDPGRLAELDKTLTIYLHGYYLSFLFKSEKFHVDGQNLLLEYPAELRVHELRDNARYYFPASETNKVVFGLMSTTDVYEEFSLHLLDISVGGLGFILGPHQGKLFYADQELDIIKLPKTDLKDPISGHVVYIKPIKDKKTGEVKFHRAGFKFNSPLKNLRFFD